MQLNIKSLEEEYFRTRFPRAHKSEVDKLKLDWINKPAAGKEVVKDFIKRAGDLKGKKVLDIGFGNGLMMGAFFNAGAEVFGLEVDDLLYKIAQINFAKGGVKGDIALYDGKNFPYESNFFDYLYSTSVLEHVTYQTEVLMESYRVLKPGGRFYLAFPNKFCTFKDSHTGIYLLSYMPRKMAQWVLRRARRSALEDWNLSFIDYFWLRRTMMRHGIKFRVLYETGSGNPVKRIAKKILAYVGIHQGAFLKQTMLILEKPGESGRNSEQG